EYRAPRDMIEVGRTYGSHHPGITRQLTLPVEPPPGSPLSGWPRETMLAWRARQRLASANREDAGIVLAELRDAGFGALATRLASQPADGGGATGDPLAAARARLASGDVAGAGAAARALLAGTRGPSRLEPLLLVGVTEFGAGNEAAALAAFADAQSISPSDARAYALEARVRLA